MNSNERKLNGYFTFLNKKNPMDEYSVVVSSNSELLSMEDQHTGTQVLMVCIPSSQVCADCEPSSYESVRTSMYVVLVKSLVRVSIGEKVIRRLRILSIRVPCLPQS